MEKFLIVLDDLSMGEKGFKIKTRSGLILWGLSQVGG